MCIHILYHILNLVQPKNTKFTMKQTPTYPVLSILCLLMPWRLTSPGHQQAWYWSNKPEYWYLVAPPQGSETIKIISYIFVIVFRVLNGSLSICVLKFVHCKTSTAAFDSVYSINKIPCKIINHNHKCLLSITWLNQIGSDQLHRSSCLLSEKGCQI